MKKFLVVSLLCSFTLINACGNDSDKVTEPNSEAPLEEDERVALGEDKTPESESPYDFTSFDLDVEYGNDSYEAEYVNEARGMEAVIEDDLKQEMLESDEAYGKLETYFTQLTFDQTTDTEDVIAQVLNIFNLPDDYTNFDLEIVYSDGTTKEYQDITKK